MGIIGVIGLILAIACLIFLSYKDLDMSDGPGKGAPQRKIGHIRADYNGHRWWDTVWGTHGDLATAEIKTEIDNTYDALTAPDALANLDTLRRFCRSHPEAQHSPEADDEFHFYLVGKACDFWVRLITREKDYNMYLSAYVKADEGREAQ